MKTINQRTKILLTSIGILVVSGLSKAHIRASIDSGIDLNKIDVVHYCSLQTY